MYGKQTKMILNLLNNDLNKTYFTCDKTDTSELFA